jgi:hypothetical protein
MLRRSLGIVTGLTRAENAHRLRGPVTNHQSRTSTRHENEYDAF